jgi:hypothetical protein
LKCYLCCTCRLEGEETGESERRESAGRNGGKRMAVKRNEQVKKQEDGGVEDAGREKKDKAQEWWKG